MQPLARREFIAQAVAAAVAATTHARAQSPSPIRVQFEPGLESPTLERLLQEVHAWLGPTRGLPPKIYVSAVLDLHKTQTLGEDTVLLPWSHFSADEPAQNPREPTRKATVAHEAAHLTYNARLFTFGDPWRSTFRKAAESVPLVRRLVLIEKHLDTAARKGGYADKQLRELNREYDSLLRRVERVSLEWAEKPLAKLQARYAELAADVQTAVYCRDLAAIPERPFDSERAHLWRTTEPDPHKAFPGVAFFVGDLLKRDPTLYDLGPLLAHAAREASLAEMERARVQGSRLSIPAPVEDSVQLTAALARQIQARFPRDYKVRDVTARALESAVREARS